jgi:hypothetical protein
MNALVAKYIFSQMSEQESQAVCEKIQTILFRAGQITPDEAARMLGGNERAFFGFAALAMMEMGIAPPKNVWRWEIIQNPFVALIKADRDIEIARVSLERKYGIKVFI